MSESRAWEEIDWHGRGPAWILCVGFGPSGTRRVVLRYTVNIWAIHYAQPDGRAWVTEGGSSLAEVELPARDVEGAQRWALQELASIACDYSQRYARQCHQLMSEILRQARPK
jgi:hypothetical protein